MSKTKQLKIPLNGSKYRLTKLSDDVFEGKHPNYILEGMQWMSNYDNKPIVGERFQFGGNGDHPDNLILTSTVMEVLEDGLFKTRNSTYKLEEI